MSRLAKWKLEKTKVKVVFRLQFHATHVPQAGWDKLFISFIPADSGKATSKTTKANVRNGTCKWADPIYETTRLLQDIRTKLYDEKLYKLVVSMGTSRSSILGEAAINLAEYADALKPSVVALPLHGCDSGTILYVTVQLLTSKTGFREFEQQRELRDRGLSATTDQSSPDEFSRIRVSTSEETLSNHNDKINSRVRFKDKSKEHPSPEEAMGQIEEYPDGSSNASESLHADKHETSSTNEIDSLKSVISGDLAGLSQSPEKDKGTSDWVHGWDSNFSGDNNDFANAIEENIRLRGCLEIAESSINELKMEVSSLQRHAAETGSEAKNFSQLLISEIASGEHLVNEVSLLKSECSKLKKEVEQLLTFKSCAPFSNKNPNNLFHDVQLRWLKGLLVVEDKIRELQNKGCYGYHDRDLRFFLSDLEALLGVLQDLKKGIGKPESTNMIEKKERGDSKTEQSGTGLESLDTDIYQPELGPLHYLSMPGFVSREPDSVDSANAMKEKIFELLRELDESKVERENLVKKMDQMECYYESLVQELEETQRQLLGELQNLRTEHSTCLYTVSSSKAEMEALRQDMNEQILRFAEEKQNLDTLNKELEKRAMTAEAALKRARLNYSIAVNQLQKDLELLSSQVVSMFETNENIIKQAIPDPSQQNFQEYPPLGQNKELDKKEFHAEKFLKSQNQQMGVKEQSLGGDILLEDLKRSLHVQEGLYQKVEEELNEMHSMNIYLEVFAKILQETLLEASTRIRIMKERIDELTWQLDLSTEAKELLKQRLDIALDEVCSLNEEKAMCITKCNDVALQNQRLEANLQNITHENLLLMQNIADMEFLVLEYKSYQSKYEACIVEKTDLASLLEKEALERGNLQTSISCLQAELETSKSKFDDLATANENLQNVANSMGNKLHNLLATYKEKLHDLSLWSGTMDLDLESHDLTVQLEKFLHNAYEKILLLLNENKDLIKEKDKARVSLSAAETDVTQMKQKFEHETQNIAAKLEASSALVQRFQLEVEAIAERLKVSYEVEENYEQNHREFISHLNCLEVEVQQLVTKNEDLGQKILALGDLANELGQTKLIVAELTDEKQAVMSSLHDKSQESLRFMLELEDSRKSFEDVLKVEKSLREELESRIENLTSDLNEKHSQMLSFNEQKSELVHLKQMVTDLESEKSTQNHLLSRYKESLRNSDQEYLYASDLKSQLLEMSEFAIAIDVQHVFTRNWWEVYAEELQKKHLEVETALKQCLANEAQCMDENARLLANLDARRSDLKLERSLRDELESRVEDLTSELNEKRLLLQNFEEQKSEVTCIQEMVSKLESEKSSQSHLLSEYENCLRSAHQESLFVDEMFEFSIASEIQLIFMRTESEFCVEELAQQLGCSSRCLDELQKKHIDVGTKLNHCHANEAQYMEENAKLLTSLDALKAKLETSIAENKALMDTNNDITVELEEHRNSAKTVERSYSNDRSQHAREVERMKDLMVNYEEEIENLMVSKTELDVNIEVLKAKVTEQHNLDSDELVMLKNRCSELSQKLSEQILKTEEFRNLSIHLKELKDKAEIECTQAREKTEYQAPLTPQQESLRIIFIKEQYETKLQELKHQLSMSKKHSEEMLMKLQDAIDEVEARKKAEASHLKRNEELGGKILEIEAELQAVISDKREKATAYDMMKAELDCSLLSLECCKEEKQKLEASLKECNQERLKISHELQMMKLVETSRSYTDFQKERNNLSRIEDQRNLVDATSSADLRARSELVHHNSMHLDQDDSLNCDERESTCSIPIDVTDNNSRPKVQHDITLSGGINGYGSQSPLEEISLNSDKEHLALINDHFRAQTLRFSLDHLNDELEKMKNENLLLPQDGNDLDTKFPGLERELMQLRRANEELQSIFPLFNEHSGCANALERVLALEIELAEALRAKNKSTIHFQSSFLKQHRNDEAIFQSFRDINDLIEEMLEMKGRYASMETELKEMHDRYSQLSLQFAEVEGERQKLIMTLKNVRASKKALLLNRSSSACLGENS